MLTNNFFFLEFLHFSNSFPPSTRLSPSPARPAVLPAHHRLFQGPQDQTAAQFLRGESLEWSPCRRYRSCPCCSPVVLVAAGAGAGIAWPWLAKAGPLAASLTHPSVIFSLLMCLRAHDFTIQLFGSFSASLTGISSTLDFGTLLI